MADIESSTGGNLLRSLVDGAHVFDHVGLDGVLSAGGVSIVHNDPRDIGVSRLELFSGISKLSHKVAALFGLRAAVNAVPVESILS